MKQNCVTTAIIDDLSRIAQQGLQGANVVEISREILRVSSDDMQLCNSEIFDVFKGISSQADELLPFEDPLLNAMAGGRFRSELDALGGHFMESFQGACLMLLSFLRAGK